MKSQEYWRKRFEALEERLLKDGDKANKEIINQYQIALASLEKDLLKWYTRLGVNNDNITLADARKLLSKNELKEFKWDVREYIKYGEQNALNQQWIRQLENASARVHISYLEAMRLQIQQQVEVIFAQQQENITALSTTLISESYYQTIFEVQKGLTVGWAIPALDPKRISRVALKPWAPDGLNFSDRIWKNKTELINVLHNELSQSIIRGDSPDGMIKLISEKFDVSKRKAGRLIMTESAFFASASQKETFNDLNVDKFEIVATLDNKTSKICQDLDGKVFDMKDYEVGTTAPPFHAWCRTVTVPYFDDNFGERAARGADGKTYYVPANITYKEWKEKYAS
ncbi:minor capsid protein [Cytobacillus gottheilii]|uniref:Minor capsid protein n=1 Tax=Cytobacillus gottheilii TaxID=859144 RepID=A0ABX8FCS5_9BACI|nr:minor capsid protein [Cytobacillus gottheilii]QVY60942.1 minor capsid protein [Cytobacillus gottheilii]